MPKKDETVIGITGKPVPKPKSPKRQYELEKKRRERKHLGKNVGGTQYSSDVNPYYNPRQRTFREFIEISEGKKKEIKRLKNAYMAGQQLAEPKIIDIPAGKPNSPERTAAIKQLMKMSGGGAVRKAIKEKEKKAEKVAKNLLKQQEAFSYNDKDYQDKLIKTKKEAEKRKEQQRQQRNSELYRERTRGRGIRSYSKGKSGWIKDGKFTPDEDR